MQVRSNLSGYPLRCNYLILSLHHRNCTYTMEKVVQILMSDSRSCRETRYYVIIFCLETRTYIRICGAVITLHSQQYGLRVYAQRLLTVDLTGFEPVTSALQMLRSTS